MLTVCWTSAAAQERMADLKTLLAKHCKHAANKEDVAIKARRSHALSHECLVHRQPCVIVAQGCARDTRESRRRVLPRKKYHDVLVCFTCVHQESVQGLCW